MKSHEDKKAKKVVVGKPDYVLLVAVALLVTLGIDMVYSASFVLAQNDPTYQQDDTYFLVRQAIWAVVGAIALLVTMRVDYHQWRRISVLLMLLMFLSLTAILVTRLGHSAYGAQRWLQFGGLPPIQPSEFAKMGLIVYIADWLSRRKTRLEDLSKSTLPFTLIVGGVAGLVLLQPDLGSSFIIVVSALCVFFIAGANLKHFFAGLVLGSIGLIVAITGTGYRMGRITAFLDPEKDPLGTGWHIIQSNIALGSGGIFGVGLGASRQKFFYLYGAHTDAIFAVIGEELGLIGAVSVMILFAIIAYRGCKITLQAPDAFGSLLAIGITCLIISQAIVNIAVVTATLPFTGVTLPFVSYGGSSLMVSMAAVGLLLNISRQRAGPRSRHQVKESK